VGKRTVAVETKLSGRFENPVSRRLGGTWLWEVGEKDDSWVMLHDWLAKQLWRQSGIVGTGGESSLDMLRLS
jgi:hypothetical protein